MNMDTYLVGDCREEMKKISDNSVNLVVTSPPYGMSRKKTYGGIDPKDYVKWFLTISSEIKRVLRDDGSFVLNIKEGVSNGERLTYVLELILALKAQGWLWTDEYIWYKTTAAPGKWPNRFRDAWERCLLFNKNKNFYMDQEAVMVPVGDWAKSRLKNLSQNDKKRMESKTGSGVGRKIENWVDRELCYPSNVLHFAAVTNNKKHSAAFPDALPEFFIKLLSKQGDIVLDPFVGSGTTKKVANRLGRICVGIDINKHDSWCF